jgi:hypothetical protein
MKLSPVANSSDIAVVRDIAQRLHRQTQPAPGTAPQRSVRSEPATPRPADPPPATPPRHAAQPPAARPVEPTRPSMRAVAPAPAADRRPAPAPWLPPVVEDAPEPASSWPPATATRLPIAAEQAPPAPPLIEIESEPAPPSWDEPQAMAHASRIQEPEDALDALTAQPGEVTGGFSVAEVPPIELEGPQDDAETLAGDPPGLEALPDADPFGSGPESPYELPAAMPSQAIEEPGPPPEEELFDTSPAPSWGEIAETCMAFAHARGALLADQTGQLVAVRGEWPEPGPEAIASRLVAMMERTLRDAPTRSVSAPVGPQHLTAWRVSVGDRLLTAAFLADSPVRADVRPSIDAEIQSGTGA